MYWYKHEHIINRLFFRQFYVLLRNSEKKYVQMNYNKCYKLAKMYTVCHKGAVIRHPCNVSTANIHEPLVTQNPLKGPQRATLLAFKLRLHCTEHWTRLYWTYRSDIHVWLWRHAKDTRTQMELNCLLFGYFKFLCRIFDRLWSMKSYVLLFWTWVTWRTHKNIQYLRYILAV